MSTQHYEINEATRFGGFWIRVVAFFIDIGVLGVLLTPPMFLVMFFPHVILPFAIMGAEVNSLLANEMVMMMVGMFFIFLLIVPLIAYWIYFAVLHSSSWQATVGKKALDLKVVDKNGDRISFGRATGRYFAGIISTLILLIGFMMVGWTKKKQGLHDMIAGTLVIKTENT